MTRRDGNNYLASYNTLLKVCSLPNDLGVSVKVVCDVVEVGIAYPSVGAFKKLQMDFEFQISKIQIPILKFKSQITVAYLSIRLID